MRKQNIEIVQSLLSQNYSIDEIAQLMDEGVGHWYEWRDKILDLIERGELRA